MSWRARTVIAISALVVFFLGTQPMLRRMVSNTIARHASGSVHLDGWTTWSASQNTLTLNRLRMLDDAGGEIRIESIAAEINPRELLRRNLVIDTATIDGVVIQLGPNAVPTFQDEANERSLRVPTFQDSVWASAIQRRCQDRMQQVTDERIGVRRSLESQCERLQQRTESLSKLEQNPLRNREYLEEARKEWVALRQAVAEERVRLREVDKELQRDTLQIHEAWPDQLADAIRSSMPNRQEAIQHAVSQRVASYLHEYQPILDVALSSALSIPVNDRSSQGVDIALPGIPDNYTLVRSVNAFGRIEFVDRLPISFKCKLANWSVPNTSNTLRPRSEWRFQMPHSGGSRAMEAVVEQVLQDEHGTSKISLAMHEDGSQLDQAATRVQWERNSHGNVLELNLPFEGPSEGTVSADPHSRWDSNTLWIESWNDVLKEGASVQMRVTARTARDRESPARVVARPLDCSLHPSSQAQLQRIWDSAYSRYTERTKEDVFPRVKQVLDETTRARQAAWIRVTSDQNELLARIDSEANRIRATLDASATIVERFARKP